MSNSYVNKIMSCKINAISKINENDNNLYNVTGKVKIESNDNLKIIYWAANPADYNTSFNGSGLPYPNPEIAYQNTKNIGSVYLNGDTYSFNILFPNSYYTNLGTTYNEPRVHIKLCSNNGNVYDIQTIILKNPIPYRSLAYAAPNLTIERNTGQCSNKSNVELTCNTYGVCNNTTQSKDEIGNLQDNSCKPFFYTDFYQEKSNPIRSQQQILWESKYPDKMKWFPNFWGNKPPK